MPDESKNQDTAQGASSAGSAGKDQSCSYNDRSYKPGEERCDEELGRIVRCENGVWVETDVPCGGGQDG